MQVSDGNSFSTVLFIGSCPVLIESRREQFTKATDRHMMASSAASAAQQQKQQMQADNQTMRSMDSAGALQRLQLDPQHAAQVSKSDRRLPALDADGVDPPPANSTVDGGESPRTALPSLVASRKNGLQAPFSRDQVISCLGHLISAICFDIGLWLILAHIDSKSHPRISLLTNCYLVFHSCTMIVLVISWVSCSSIDPSLPYEQVLPHGWFGIKLTGPRWDKTRYCAICKKQVPGLDHHCTWLQTCVGRANYAQFFTIACCGNVQFFMQNVYCLLFFFNVLKLRASSCSPDGQCASIESLMGISLVISLPCSVMYAVLLGFHVLLMFWGYGTYDWMLKRRRRQRERLAKRKAAESAAESDANGTINTTAASGSGSGNDNDRGNLMVTSRQGARPSIEDITYRSSTDDSSSSRSSRGSSGALTPSVSISIDDSPRQVPANGNPSNKTQVTSL